ncbi:MAG: M14 family zinc carboxypeptidase [Planctomycetota bacterium]
MRSADLLRRTLLLTTFLLCTGWPAGFLRAQQAGTQAGAAEAFEMLPGTTYDPAIPKLDAVIGHAPGERISSHSEVERYLQALATAAPDRVRLVEFGESWQGRKLYYVVVARPDNLRRIDSIQRDMQQLADPRKLDEAAADALLKDLPAVGWLANCVHGDEPSGTDAALFVLYHLLAAQGDAIVDKVLDECVVLIDPLQNPDGRDRFVFYTRGARGRWPDAEPTAAEHSQPWPSGRTNHAMFDMNRDWFAISQPESEARIRAFLEWYPLVYVDLHEMGGNSSYYFPPPAQPIHEEITPTQRSWLQRYGKNNARWFDRFGFDYFTREAYDSFYPGYGESWPTFQGSVGMTFEMASARGLMYRRRDEMLLRYRDGVQRHFVASMATLETLANNRLEAQRSFLQHRRAGVARGQSGDTRAYVFPPSGDRTRLARLANLLMQQGVEVHEATAELRASVRALGDKQASAAERAFPTGSLIVSMAQPASTLATVLLQPHFDMQKEFLDEQKRRERRRRGTEFYDLTAWSLPLLFDVECFEATAPPTGQLRLLAAGQATSGAPPLREKAPDVAYVVAWDGNGAAALLAELLRMGVRARCLDEPFAMGERTFPAGSFVVRVHNQPDELNRAELHQRMTALAKTHGVTPFCADSSWVDDGPNFGSNTGQTLKAPRIAMAWDRPVNTYSAGWLRYLLEQRYGLPVTPIRTREIGRADLDRFTVLILPEGYGYQSVLGSRGSKAVTGFVERGGVLITLGSATRWLTSKDVGLLATKAEDRDSAKRKPTAQANDEKASAGESKDEGDEKPFDYERAVQPDKESPPSTPGAILSVYVDREHWLGFGYPKGKANVVHDSANIMTPVKLDRGTNVAVYAIRSELVQAGFVWEASLAQLPRKAYLMHQPKGRGHVVAFAEDPNVRAFADGLNLFLLNAVLLTAGR